MEHGASLGTERGIRFDTSRIRFRVDFMGRRNAHLFPMEESKPPKMPFAVCCCSKPGPDGLMGCGAGFPNQPEDAMSADRQFLEEWIPERMDPGTIFVLANQAKLGNAQNPYVAVMSCPRCGTMGLITRRQARGVETMICGGDACSAEYRLEGETINYRKAQ